MRVGGYEEWLVKRKGIEVVQGRRWSKTKHNKERSGRDDVLKSLNISFLCSSKIICGLNHEKGNVGDEVDLWK